MKGERRGKGKAKGGKAERKGEKNEDFVRRVDLNRCEEMGIIKEIIM